MTHLCHQNYCSILHQHFYLFYDHRPSKLTRPQRAFRQRKEGHIKQLEAQVKDYSSLTESFKAIQAENYQLRDYIISLQSRLIESQGEFPQPPSNIDLPRPSGHPHQHMQAPTAPMGSSAASQLQASAAQAVADLGSDHQLDGSAYRVSNQASQRSRIGDSNDPSNRHPGP